MAASKSNPIAIIGGGAFGLSTAFELSKQGYTDVTVFEKDDRIPSRWSAANDLNKVVRVEYEDDFYTKLAYEAVQEWQTPLYAPYFHRVGFLNCVSEKGNQKAFDTMRRFQAAAERHPVLKPFVCAVDGRDQIRKDCSWQFHGQMPGWRGYFNRYDGYAHSADALRGICQAASANGVRFFAGRRQGAVREIVYESNTLGRKCVGVRTENGRFHAARLVIVAVGAAASTFVQQLGTRVVAKSWSVAHIRLTDEETSALRGIPVTYARDLGFFFEPDPKTNLLKICPMGGGYINTDRITGISKAPETLAESQFIPHHDEWKMRELLRQTLPHLADRPLVDKSLCWFADTDDSDFIIDYIPQTASSVIVLTGDSGHGFKMFPIVGRWVADLIESTSQQKIHRWRWREPGLKDSSAASDDVSWRVGDVSELQDIRESEALPKL